MAPRFAIAGQTATGRPPLFRPMLASHCAAALGGGEAHGNQQTGRGRGGAFDCGVPARPIGQRVIAGR